MICKIYPANTLKNYRYVVILSCYDGRILLSRHKDRDTWETQRGHIEPGESPLEAAKRELYEESGADIYNIKPLCDYWAGEENTKEEGNGMVFTAIIHKLAPLPKSEMAETGLFDHLPEKLTYPDITPVLFSQIARGQEP